MSVAVVLLCASEIEPQLVFQKIHHPEKRLGFFDRKDPKLQGKVVKKVVRYPLETKTEAKEKSLFRVFHEPEERVSIILSP